MIVAPGVAQLTVTGRYYPDDPCDYDWLPERGEVLIMGQTHYPLVCEQLSGGLILNPGSVGQPRDGDPRPAWILLELPTWRTELRRSSYGQFAAIEALERMDWDTHARKALNKNC